MRPRLVIGNYCPVPSTFVNGPHQPRVYNCLYSFAIPFAFCSRAHLISTHFMIKITLTSWLNLLSFDRTNAFGDLVFFIYQKHLFLKIALWIIVISLKPVILFQNSKNVFVQEKCEVIFEWKLTCQVLD